MSEDVEPTTPETILASVVITLGLTGEIRSVGQGLDRARLNMMIVTAHQDLLGKMTKPETTACVNHPRPQVPNARGGRRPAGG